MFFMAYQGTEHGQRKNQWTWRHENRNFPNWKANRKENEKNKKEYPKTMYLHKSVTCLMGIP